MPINSKHQIYQYRFSLPVTVVCLCSLGSSINVDVFYEECGVEGWGSTKGPTPKAKLCSLVSTVHPYQYSRTFFLYIYSFTNCQQRKWDRSYYKHAHIHNCNINLLGMSQKPLPTTSRDPLRNLHFMSLVPHM